MAVCSISVGFDTVCCVVAFSVGFLAETFNATHKKREGAAHFNRMTKSTGNTEPKNTRTIESEKTTKGECAAELKISREHKNSEIFKDCKKCELIFLAVAIMIIMLPKKPSFEIDMLDVGQGTASI